MTNLAFMLFLLLCGCAASLVPTQNQVPEDFEVIVRIWPGGRSPIHYEAAAKRSDDDSFLLTRSLVHPRGRCDLGHKEIPVEDMQLLHKLFPYNNSFQPDTAANQACYDCGSFSTTIVASGDTTRISISPQVEEFPFPDFEDALRNMGFLDRPESRLYRECLDRFRNKDG